MKAELSFVHNLDKHAGHLTLNDDGSVSYSIGHVNCQGVKVNVDGTVSAADMRNVQLADTRARAGWKELQFNGMNVGYAAKIDDPERIEVFETFSGEEINIRVSGVDEKEARSARFIQLGLAAVGLIAVYTYAAYTDMQCRRLARACMANGCSNVYMQVTGYFWRTCTVNCTGCP